ncbi:MAG: 50S ribosomal protein L18e [Candidatus Woesearchaeota archaeon]
MRTGPTNQELQALIAELRKLSYKEKADIWKRVAVDLAKPARQRRAINLSRINRYSSKDETVVVPGKVLASGVLDHPVSIAAFSFSGAARETIAKSKGAAITIAELLKQNPKGKNVRIIG